MSDLGMYNYCLVQCTVYVTIRGKNQVVLGKKRTCGDRGEAFTNSFVVKENLFCGKNGRRAAVWKFTVDWISIKLVCSVVGKPNKIANLNNDIISC